VQRDQFVDREPVVGVQRHGVQHEARGATIRSACRSGLPHVKRGATRCSPAID
jgi:hypothetical protein